MGIIAKKMSNNMDVEVWDDGEVSVDTDEFGVVVNRSTMEWLVMVWSRYFAKKADPEQDQTDEGHMEYKLVKELDDRDLMTKVNELARKGWEAKQMWRDGVCSNWYKVILMQRYAEPRGTS